MSPGTPEASAAEEAAHAQDADVIATDDGVDGVDSVDGAATADEHDADDGGAVAPAEGRPRADRRVALLTLACAVLLVVAVVTATMAAVFKGRVDGDRRRQRQIRNVSASMVTALMTYDFAKLDDSRRQVLALATGRFQTEYDQGAAPLRTVLTQTQSRSTGTVKEVFVGDNSGDSAHAIVIADQVLTGVGGTRALTGQQLTLTLVRLKSGTWKVDGLSVDVPSGDDGQGGATSTTSTPPPTR